MTEIFPSTINKKTVSDTIIDGLFAGLVAGAVMSIVLLLTGLVIGEKPAGIFSLFSPGSNQAPLTGLLLHLAVSAIYGAIFSLMLCILPVTLLRRIPAWVMGLIYGIFLLGVALGILMPGMQSPLSELPTWMLAISHASYGFILSTRAYPKW